MELKPLSTKQFKILQEIVSDNNYLICDGAVRSGKTVIMTMAFVMWAMSTFDRTNFAICGKTVANAERNIIKPFMAVEGLPYTMRYKKSERVLVVQCGTIENYFYCFGGKDESSYMLVQGITLAGALLDEVALMPRSFVEQVITRTLTYANKKVWFNCNPESPNHWFYNEWILEPKPKSKHLHFLMEDNPIITQNEIEQAKQAFTGVFYDRYIKGLWVRAEGIIFPEFADCPDRWLISADKVPKHFQYCISGLDIGGNGSHHAMVCTARGYDDVYYVLKSIDVIPKDMNMLDIEKMVIDFCGSIERKYGVSVELINSDWVDVVINSVNDNTPYRCRKTYKPPLDERPLAISRLLATDMIKFVDGETDSLIEQLQNVVYDDKSERAIILDNGEMCIDNVDAFVYSVDDWNYLTI